MADEAERIRELAIRVLNANDRNRKAAIAALQTAVSQYLEEQSDEILLADLKELGAGSNGKKFPAA